MTRITSTDFQRSVGMYCDTALQEPVIITNHNRDRLVLMDIEEYRRLKALADAITPERREAMTRIFDTHQDTFEKLAL
ncbi:MAG: type II toxin-antitoxin system Phd/YefM family antitoxin [Alphaproteobacteria bacterium]|nr:type II toxin-antitoxin system Phd/YefM family antitoxin [Alphaproteobacteria bacterium]